VRVVFRSKIDDQKACHVPRRSWAATDQMEFLRTGDGEDPAAYDELLARVSGAIKPSDILEEIWSATSSTLSGTRCACAG
jgi:hypothetical protein